MNPLPVVMTLEEVATYVHATPGKLKEAILDGRLRGFEVGQDEWRVTEPALLEFIGEMESQHAGGRKQHESGMHLRSHATTPPDIRYEDAQWHPSGSFEYQWPKDLEQMDSSFSTTLTINGDNKAFTIGFTNRESAGMLRRRAIVFLELGPQRLKPLVEFVGSNEFATNGQMASPIKVVGDSGSGWRLLQFGESLPSDYTGLTITEYRDVVRGPNAVRAIAVVAQEDDLTVMLRHGIIRATWKGWL